MNLMENMNSRFSIRPAKCHSATGDESRATARNPGRPPASSQASTPPDRARPALRAATA